MKYQDLTLLLVHHYCTSNFLFHKKVQSQRFALQELLKQFLLVYRYCTGIFLFHKKEQIVTFDRYLKFRISITFHEITICSFLFMIDYTSIYNAKKFAILFLNDYPFATQKSLCSFFD